MKTNNAHSRGIASLGVGQGVGVSTAKAQGHRGNIGLTDTDPIDPNFSAQQTDATLTVIAVTENPPPPPQTSVINGLIISGVNGVQATKVQIIVSDMNCNRLPDGYTCWLGANSNNPTLKVDDYDKLNTILVACSATLATLQQTANSTTFSLLGANTNLNHNIVIQEDSCTL